jgi:hypothetical protein
MGVVYEAFHRDLQRRCALKTLNPQLADPAGAQRFVEEGRSAAKLSKHPNIVQVFDAGVVDGTPYIAMEFVPGLELADRVEKQGQVPEEELLEIGRKLALALAHAHQHKIVHRDMKPANVVLDDNGEPQILDFGLAKDVGRTGVTGQGEIVGTPAYMPPEQADPSLGALDHRSDIYALGATLYHAAAGKVPFDGKSVVATFAMVMFEDPQDLAKEANVSRDLAAIVQKAMEKEQKLRYQTALDMADDLTRVIAGEPPKVRPLGPLGRIGRKARRHPGLFAFGLLFTLLTLAVSIYLLIQRREVDALWEQVTGQIASQTATEVRGLLEPALPLLEECRAFSEYGLMPVHDPEALVEHLAVRFRFRERLDWLSFSDATGRFTGVNRRPEDRELVLNMSWVDERGRSHMREALMLDDGGRSALRSSDDWKYDPREQSWYKLAMRSTEPAWTAPYDWYGGEGVGITLTLPLRDETAPVGAFTADFRLDSISQFLGGLQVGARGEAFVMTRQGRIFAGPGVKRVLPFDGMTPELLDGLALDAEQRQMVHAAGAAVSTLPDGLEALALGAPESVTFVGGDVRYIAAFQAFTVGGGIEWVSAVVVPYADFHGDVERLTRLALFGGLGALALGALLGVWAFIRRRRKLRTKMRRNPPAPATG